MISLGISPLAQDATAALLVDGHVVAAVAEERLSRRRLQAGFPVQAIEMVLRLAGVEPHQVDAVGYAHFDAATQRQLMRRHSAADWHWNRTSQTRSLTSALRLAKQRRATIAPVAASCSGYLRPIETSWWKRLVSSAVSSTGFVGDLVNQQQYVERIETTYRTQRQHDQELIAGLCEFGLGDKLLRVDHHLAHAASAFYGSGFQRALVVTLDADESGTSATVSSGTESGIQPIAELPAPYSLAAFQDTVVAALKLPAADAVRQFSALAAHGDAHLLGDLLRTLVSNNPRQPRWRRSSDHQLAGRLAATFPQADVAAGYQAVLAEIVLNYVEHHLQVTGHTNLALAGSVAGNAALVQLLHELPGVANIYVHPNMEDGGCAVGAAMLLSARGGERIAALPSVNLGPDYSACEMETALAKLNIACTYCDDIEREIARLLAEQYVVARFDGRMEYGPRALGNRSVLCGATDARAKQWLNERLHRNGLLPLEPATLATAAHDCYHRVAGAELAAQAMTIRFACTPWMRKHTPAVVHVDGTACPQLVSATSNPSLHRVLSEYQQLTGLPTIINTEFRIHNEPLVCSPQHALRSFLASGIDFLAIGDYLVASPTLSKRPQHQFTSAGV
ncbi:MAG TPA: carbamoyltransferase C-terminal domain-containing protein [Pirellulaceae bacterium]|nr:carbamoyltransferase C-terminal domain-containing protein [Pirellulaceae bacterium]